MRRGPGKFGDRYQRPVKARHNTSAAAEDKSSSSTGLKKDGSGPYFLPLPLHLFTFPQANKCLITDLSEPTGHIPASICMRVICDTHDL